MRICEGKLVSSKKIAVLATGGTIAGQAASANDNVGYVAAQLGIDELIAALPALQDWPLVAEQVVQGEARIALMLDLLD